MLIASTDTETTGFLEPDHRIIEVYIDLIDMASRKTLWTMNKRVNPLRSVPPDATAVHGITGAALLNEKTWEEIGPVAHAALSKASLFVAHNAEFDFGFYNQEFQRIGLPKLNIPVFCTMKNGGWAAPTGKSPSLLELAWALGVPYDTSLAHAADYDVKVMNQCLFRGMDLGFFTLPDAAMPMQMAA